MKLKCQPEDFRVEELPLVSPAGAGRYAFYRLTKRNIGTIEAVEAICRRWNLAGRRVSYGGLKDRHAVTVQYLTIADGPAQAHQHAQLRARARGPVGTSLWPATFPRQPFPARPPRHDRSRCRPRLVRNPVVIERRTPQLFRRSAVRLGRLFRPVHRSCLAGRRSRACAQAGAGGGQSVRPVGNQGSEGHLARIIGDSGRRRRPGWNGRPLAAS